MGGVRGGGGGEGEGSERESARARAISSDIEKEKTRTTPHHTTHNHTQPFHVHSQMVVRVKPPQLAMMAEPRHSVANAGCHNIHRNGGRGRANRPFVGCPGYRVCVSVAPRAPRGRSHHLA